MTTPFDNLHFISNYDQTDPAFNLALEEYAVRHLSKENDYLLLYENRPSVILGKHQNVAEEVNQRYCTKHNIPVLRRISGGGTVYHDEGNLNFSYITGHTLNNFNNYSKFIKPILKILHQFDPLVELDAVNNLVFQGKKLSGNAQFTSAGRLLSHGTLLFNVDINRLRNSLKIDPEMLIESRSTKSRRALVTNLCTFNPFKDLIIPEFKRLLLDEIFQGKMAGYQLSHKDNAQIAALASSKYRNWDWNYGRSPNCGITKNLNNGGTLEMMIKKGRIAGIKWSGEEHLQKIFKQLNGQKYDYNSMVEYIKTEDQVSFSDSDQVLDILF